MSERISKFENMHILFWLCKDISWCMEWKIFGLIMVIPTISLALFITYIARHNRRDKFHNIAVSLWISANSIWMIGEFYGYDSFRNDAGYFFIAGIAFILWYYLSDFFMNKQTPQASK